MSDQILSIKLVGGPPIGAGGNQVAVNLIDGSPPEVIYATREDPSGEAPLQLRYKLKHAPAAASTFVYEFDKVVERRPGSVELLLEALGVSEAERANLAEDIARGAASDS